MLMFGVNLVGWSLVKVNAFICFHFFLLGFLDLEYNRWGDYHYDSTLFSSICAISCYFLVSSRLYVLFIHLSISLFLCFSVSLSIDTGIGISVYCAFISGPF